MTIMVLLGGIFLLQQLQQVLAMNEEERRLYMQAHEEQLLTNMIKHIGDPNSTLRDQTNYRLFMELLSANHWKADSLRTLTMQLIDDEHLFLHIQDREATEAVFTRSFSALWLTALLHADAQLRFLQADDLTEIFQQVARYFTRERDVRGFINDEQGWAHSMAHVADLCVASIRHPQFEVRYAPMILQGVKDAFWKGSVYIDDEEERFAKVIESLIAIDFPEEILIEWVEQVFDKLEVYLYEAGYTKDWFKARSNTMHFMKTMYFAVKFSNKYEQLRAVTSILIQKWMKLN